MKGIELRMRTEATFPARISEEIWDQKYRLRSSDGTPQERSLDDTFLRVASAAAAAERGGRKVRERWTGRYVEAMSSLEFLPAGRILAGAGTDRKVTLFNCFVMGTIPDDLGGIFDAVKEAAVTMQAGGGIGHDFSTLRPRGAPVRSIGADASGPLSFMDVWDAMCRTIMSAGARRGAMMATMRCDHPDIEDFISAKSDAARLRNFNMSVLVTDAFMDAVAGDRPWDLVFGGKVYRTVAARALWERLMRSTYEFAEPGVVFIDRINAGNNLRYCEEIRATNPCGEQPLPPYGACLLGSINLARLVVEPFTAGSRLDLERLAGRTRLAVRFLDSVIDISHYPLKAQRREARSKRRIGLGVTGLADALIYCGVRYGSAEAAALAESWMRLIQRTAYATSAELAAEKGPFPLYEKDAFLASVNVAALDAETRAAIARHGIRNGCLTSIAPTGTISLLAGNVSSGIEPVFDLVHRRRVLNADGSAREETVDDEAYRRFRRVHGEAAPLPPAFVTATELTPREHIVMQAAMQRHVDSAISKTVNCPADMDFKAFEGVYLEAYRQGLKGCTTFRPNAITGSVLSVAEAGSEPADGDLAEAEHETEHGLRAGGGTSSVPQPTAGPVPLAALSRSGDIVYMARPLERDSALSGYTYKLKWPMSDHAIYVTINDIEREGRRRPFEIFINTRNLEHYAWTVALTRMISAVFRRGGDVTFVAEELKAVFDPQGGQWMQGRYVPSLLAAIGEVIEAHMSRIGFLRETADLPATGDHVEVIEDGERPPEARQAAASTVHRAGAAAKPPRDGGKRRAMAQQATAGTLRPRLCPRCSSTDYAMREGCWTCRACGFSRCG